MSGWRYQVIKVVFLLITFGLWIRLAYWQVVAADDLQQQASGQRLTTIDMPGVRGEILASDGFPLAANRTNYLLFANPKLAQTGNNWDKLGQFLPASDAARLSEKLSWKNLAWVALSDRISEQNKKMIEDLKLDGLGFESRPIRFYPEGSSSAHLLGFVASDASGVSKGYFGLEGYYDRKLAGRPGKVVMEIDALGRPIVISGQNTFPAVDGQSVQTSIDRTLQFILIEKLAKGMQRYGAMSGTITVMDPFSGKIMAMVSLPNYDPSNYQQATEQLYKNPVVSEAYEPGSTFKVVAMGAALDAGAISPDTICDICSGPARIGEYTIRTWNDKYFPNSTMTDVIVHSDNVGMVYVSKKLGKEKLLDYLHKFGIGQLTGVDLQDESTPNLRPDRDWTEVDLATAAFGQGIALTPIQMLRSAAVVANGGRLPEPRLAENPSEGKRVISEVAAAQVTQMMIKAVDEGEAKWAKPSGYTVAGKTGTAQIPVAGHYDDKKTIASFVGFAPAYQPKFVMLVTLREPQSSPWGSETAAPLWFDAATDMFRYLQIAPDKGS